MFVYVISDWVGLKASLQSLRGEFLVSGQWDYFKKFCMTDLQMYLKGLFRILRFQVYCWIAVFISVVTCISTIPFKNQAP